MVSCAPTHRERSCCGLWPEVQSARLRRVVVLLPIAPASQDPGIFFYRVLLQAGRCRGLGPVG
eukprot:11200051-Lingulodinium_polyedra.AAC.1